MKSNEIFFGKVSNGKMNLLQGLENRILSVTSKFLDVCINLQIPNILKLQTLFLERLKMH